MSKFAEIRSAKKKKCMRKKNSWIKQCRELKYLLRTTQSKKEKSDLPLNGDLKRLIIVFVEISRYEFFFLIFL